MLQVVEELVASSSSSSSEDSFQLLSSDEDEFMDMCEEFYAESELSQRNRAKNFVIDVVAKYSDEELAGFPNVIGCIDGCYIYIRKTINQVCSPYVNRHGLIPITLQGICDANQKFLDVFIGSPSKINDSQMYNLSFISKKIPRICGEEYHILGDAAYPLREFLLTPYTDNDNLTQKRSNYNKKHCQTRVKIENAFGLLKQRFRQLIRLELFEAEEMCKFVLGCCVLHNLCIEDGDLWEENENNTKELSVEAALEETTTNTNRTNENIDLSEAVLKHLGELKRTTIAESF